MGYAGLVIPGVSCYVKGLVVPGFRYTGMSLYIGVRCTWGFHSKYFQSSSSCLFIRSSCW